jgi:hypothetical protein
MIGCFIEQYLLSCITFSRMIYIDSLYMVSLADFQLVDLGVYTAFCSLLIGLDQLEILVEQGLGHLKQ